MPNVPYVSTKKGVVRTQAYRASPESPYLAIEPQRGDAAFCGLEPRALYINRWDTDPVKLASPSHEDVLSNSSAFNSFALHAKTRVLLPLCGALTQQSA